MHSPLRQRCKRIQRFLPRSSVSARLKQYSSTPADPLHSHWSICSHFFCPYLSTNNVPSYFILEGLQPSSDHFSLLTRMCFFQSTSREKIFWGVWKFHYWFFHFPPLAARASYLPERADRHMLCQWNSILVTHSLTQNFHRLFFSRRAHVTLGERSNWARGWKQLRDYVEEGFEEFLKSRKSCRVCKGIKDESENRFSTRRMGPTKARN